MICNPVGVYIVSPIAAQWETPEKDEVIETPFIGGVKDYIIHRVLKLTCKYFGVSVQDVLGKRRLQILVVARHTSMYLIRKLTHLSYSLIGKIFNRDHSTALVSCNLVNDMCRVDEVYRHDVESIESIL